jgi:hypothetical protein
MSEAVDPKEELKESQGERKESQEERKESQEERKESPSPSPENTTKTQHTDQNKIGIFEHFIEFLFRKIIFWENDDKRIGTIIRFFHNAFFYAMICIYIINHTILPSYFIFITFYLICLLVWLQHMICGDCVVHLIEHRLLGDKKGVLNPFMELFDIHSDEYNTKILVMSSTIVVGMLTFEFFTRTIFLFQHWLF